VSGVTVTASPSRQRIPLAQSPPAKSIGVLDAAQDGADHSEADARPVLLRLLDCDRSLIATARWSPRVPRRQAVVKHFLRN
jgi:hypothetical protein